MPEPDMVALFRELTDVADEMSRGSSLREVLVRGLAVAQRLAGAQAGCYVALEPAALRVVATTEASAWLEGRHFPLAGSALGALLAGVHRTQMFDRSGTSAPAQNDLSAHGVHRVALSRVDHGARCLGAIALFFADPKAELTPLTEQIFEYFAAAAGALATLRPATMPDQFGVVADAVPDGLAVMDADGLVRSWNSAAYQLSGVEPADALGHPLPFPVPEPGQVLESRLDNGRWVELRAETLDSVGRRVVTFRDVTEPRMRNEGRDLFLTTTSHELRTPLTVVRGYAETLANRWHDLDEPARLAAVRAIHHRTRHLAALVDRLLLADSTHSGEVAMERVPFNLRGALLAAVRVAPEPENTKPAVVHLPDSLPWAVGDERSIGMIVNELLTNADKYSPAGGEVTLSADAETSSVFFRVADRGIGVQPDHVDAVFSRFWQAERGDQRRFGGVGLGLYIIRRLLDRQGGWVSLRPRPGGGTVVEVRLPRADPPGSEATDRS